MENSVDMQPIAVSSDIPEECVTAAEIIAALEGKEQDQPPETPSEE